MFLLCLQQDATIKNRNLLRDESFAPEKLSTVLFGTGRLKITMKRHMACWVYQYYTSNSCPYATHFETVGWRLQASELGKKTLRACSGKQFFIIEKNTKGNQFFVKLFLLFAFEVILSKLLTPPSAYKKNLCTA